MSKLFTLVVEIETWRVRSFQYPNYSKIARALNPYNNHCFADQVDEEHLRPATSELKRSVIASKSEAEAGSRARSVKLPNAIYCITEKYRRIHFGQQFSRYLSIIPRSLEDGPVGGRRSKILLS